jgi:hypothetical protein
MHTDMKRPSNKKEAHNLYAKYMAMALDTRLKGDRVLFDTYYRRAEDYLCLMNKLGNNASTTSNLPFKKNKKNRNQKPKGDI